MRGVRWDGSDGGVLAELQQRVAGVAGEERQRAGEGRRRREQADDAEGAPRRHHLHLRHRYVRDGPWPLLRTRRELLKSFSISLRSVCSSLVDGPCI